MLARWRAGHRPQGCCAGSCGAALRERGSGDSVQRPPVQQTQQIDGVSAFRDIVRLPGHNPGCEDDQRLRMPGGVSQNAACFGQAIKDPSAGTGRRDHRVGQGRGHQRPPARRGLGTSCSCSQSRTRHGDKRPCDRRARGWAGPLHLPPAQHIVRHAQFKGQVEAADPAAQQASRGGSCG